MGVEYTARTWPVQRREDSCFTGETAMFEIRRSFAWIVVAVTVLGTAASAATYHVNNEVGRDSYNGLSAKPGPNGAGPFTTIQAGTVLLGAGDTLSLANTGVPYRESIIFFGVRGTPARPIVVEGNGATITGLRPLTEWVKQDDGSYLCPTKGRPYGFAFLMVDGARRNPARKGEPTPELCVWDSTGVHFVPEAGKAIGDYEIEGTLLVSGLLTSNSSYVVVRNLISEYHSNDGYNIHGECRGWYFENIEGRYNGDDGFSIHETIGAVVRSGHFHHNSFGVQDVNGSRTILNGVTVDHNKVGFSMIAGFRSMVDCVARDNTNAQITLTGSNPGHLIGSAHNPICRGLGYLKNVLVMGGPTGFSIGRGASAMVEHCVFTGSDVGIRAGRDGTLHLTASIVAHCGKLELESATTNFFRDGNIYFPGRLSWLGQVYTEETWDAFREAAGHDQHSLIADPKLIEGTAQVASDSPALTMAPIKGEKYKIRVRPGFHPDSATESLVTVSAFEAERVPCETAAVVEDATASEGKAVALSEKGAGISTKVKLDSGTHAVLVMAKGLGFGRDGFAVTLGPNTQAGRCVPFSWYAPRLLFEVDEPGEHDLTVTWQQGQVWLDRVTIAKVRDH